MVKVGVIVLGVAFLVSGVYNVLRPGAAYTPSAGESQDPPEEFIRKKRRMGILWIVLGALVSYYGVQYFLGLL